MDTRNMMGEEFTPTTVPSSDEKTMAILSHILALVSSFIGPLIIYLIKNKDSQFIAAHARESLNFQITILILYFICMILVLILIGVFLVWMVGVINVILAVVAAIRASENKLYRYPFNIRLIS